MVYTARDFVLKISSVCAKEEREREHLKAQSLNCSGSLGTLLIADVESLTRASNFSFFTFCFLFYFIFFLSSVVFFCYCRTHGCNVGEKMDESCVKTAKMLELMFDD